MDIRLQIAGFFVDYELGDVDIIDSVERVMSIFDVDGFLSFSEYFIANWEFYDNNENGNLYVMKSGKKLKKYTSKEVFEKWARKKSKQEG